MSTRATRDDPAYVPPDVSARRFHEKMSHPRLLRLWLRSIGYPKCDDHAIYGDMSPLEIARVRGEHRIIRVLLMYLRATVRKNSRVVPLDKSLRFGVLLWVERTSFIMVNLPEWAHFLIDIDRKRPFESYHRLYKYLDALIEVWDRYQDGLEKAVIDRRKDQAYENLIQAVAAALDTYESVKPAPKRRNQRHG